MSKLWRIVWRVGGIALVTVAVSYAFDPNWPIPLGEARGSEAPARPVWRPPPVHSLVVWPDPQAGSPAFVWRAEPRWGSWQVVLLDAHRREIAWGAEVAETVYHPEGEFREALLCGRGRFWYAFGSSGVLVDGAIGGEVVTSPVTPLPPAVSAVPMPPR